MRESGIYIVQLRNEVPIPVTRDRRYVETCGKVNRGNIKVGKAKNFATREKNYWKDFDRDNVHFEPLAELVEIVVAERVILRALSDFRKLSPNGRRMEWLEGISYQEAKRLVFAALDRHGLEYVRRER